MSKRLVVLAGVLLLLTWLATACSGTSSASTSAANASSQGGPPRIVVDNAVLDYGKVHYNQWVKPDFRIRNEGGSNLVLQKPTVKTVEGC
ncbi:MAG TPA: hypothetical protein VHS06_10415 [Chloroflexota bacterium]|nr:hypothetical protein [Chloroflexota bacterium]